MAGPFFDVGTQTADFREKEKKVGRNKRELKNLTISFVNQPMVTCSSNTLKSTVNTRNSSRGKMHTTINPLKKSTKKECKNKTEVGASKNRIQQRRTLTHSSKDGDQQKSTRKYIRFNNCRRCYKFARKGETLCQNCVNLRRQQRPQKLRQPLDSSRVSQRTNPTGKALKRSFGKSSNLYRYGSRCAMCRLLKEVKKPACENCQKKSSMVKIKKTSTSGENKDTKKLTEKPPGLRKQNEDEDPQTSVLNKAEPTFNKDEDSKLKKEDASSDSDGDGLITFKTILLKQNEIFDELKTENEEAFFPEGSEYIPSSSESSESSIQLQNQSGSGDYLRSNNDELIVENINIKSTKRGRRRKANRSQWKDVIRKQKKNKGEQFINRKGKLVKQRQLKGGCTDKCIRKCQEKINFATRQQLFKEFWKMGDHTLQTQYISRLISRYPKNRILNSSIESRRKWTFQYRLPLNDSYIVVCKKMFLDTFDITDSWVMTMSKKMSEVGLIFEDMRGKHTKRRQRVVDEIK
ncbi:unnamed protein product [Diabrotica balteata]|uniref:Uncharacterized protein n=1 Tax=Diabrotica balteata TaxID=107213 RepID=A0A9P0DUA5_DIABA|nr:unnamed protein product [Diabrotica balteata]